MKNNATKQQKEYMGLVASRGCIVCGSDALIHHLTHKHCHEGPEERITRNHWLVIPLCEYHHVDSKAGIHAHNQWWFYNEYDINLPAYALWSYFDYTS